jgi:transcriptional regulator GlxA family with amidase domain
MKTAFVIFNRMTLMDFIGAYDPLTRLKSMGLMPGFEWDICACTADVVDDRVVDEGGIITARSVTSAIDLGLYLVERLAGAEVRARVATQMDYPYVL